MQIDKYKYNCAKQFHVTLQSYLRAVECVNKNTKILSQA